MLQSHAGSCGGSKGPIGVWGRGVEQEYVAAFHTSQLCRFQCGAEAYFGGNHHPGLTVPQLMSQFARHIHRVRTSKDATGHPYTQHQGRKVDAVSGTYQHAVPGLQAMFDEACSNALG
jgi:hypothetical protein